MWNRWRRGAREGGRWPPLFPKPRKRTAALAEKGDGRDPPLARCPGRGQQVGTLPAGAMENQEIGRSAKRLHLASKDLLEPQIIAGSGEDRAVGGECHRRERLAIRCVADHIFRG